MHIICVYYTLHNRIKEPVVHCLVQTSFENSYYKCFSHTHTYLFVPIRIYSYAQFPKFSAYPFIYRFPDKFGIFLTEIL